MKDTLMILLASVGAACGQVQYAFTNFAGMPGGPGNALERGAQGESGENAGIVDYFLAFRFGAA